MAIGILGCMAVWSQPKTSPFYSCALQCVSSPYCPQCPRLRQFCSAVLLLLRANLTKRKIGFRGIVRLSGHAILTRPKTWGWREGSEPCREGILGNSQNTGRISAR